MKKKIDRAIEIEAGQYEKKNGIGHPKKRNRNRKKTKLSNGQRTSVIVYREQNQQN